MELTNKETFFERQASMTDVPHTQSRARLDYIGAKRGKEIVYFCGEGICCWGEVYKVPLAGRVLRIDGESVRGELSAREITAFYGEIARYADRERFAFVRLSSMLLYSAEYEIGVRQAGFVSPMSLSLCPLTVLIDPMDEQRKPSRSWSFRYKQAKRADFGFMEVENVECP